MEARISNCRQGGKQSLWGRAKPKAAAAQRAVKEQHGLKDSEPISHQPIPGLFLSSNNKKTMFQQILTPRPLPLDY